RQSTKYNGVPYIVQRGAEAVYSDAGQSQVKALVAGYLENATIIRSSLEQLGLSVFGGVNAPYAWVECPDGADSWSFFDRLLHECGIVCTPGRGFGASGEGYIRLSAFNNRQNVEEAMSRMTQTLQSR